MPKFLEPIRNERGHFTLPWWWWIAASVWVVQDAVKEKIKKVFKKKKKE